MIKYSVGIDIGSTSMDVCMSSINQVQQVKVCASKKFNNTLPGFKQLIIWINKHRKQSDIPLVTCMEATGIYYEMCAMYLFEKGYNLSIILPNKAKKYIQALGIKTKNDKTDAKALAQMGAEQSLSLWKPMGKYFYELRSLTRQHQALQEQKTMVKNQLHALEKSMYPSKFVIKQLKSSIKYIQTKLKKYEIQILNHLKGEEVIYEKALKLCSIKGVGIHTVAIILAETNGFELFKSAKQLVSFAGYDVVENQSGNRTGRTRISKKGNSRIRRAMFMPAFGVVKYTDSKFYKLYERTYAKHGIKMKSYVAVQKKLLTIIYALWKRNEEYDPVNTNNKEMATSSLMNFVKIQKSSTNYTASATQGNYTINLSITTPL